MQLIAPDSAGVTTLPPWLGSVEDARGDLAAVHADPRRIPALLAHLRREGWDYYFPREEIVRWREGKGRDRRSRAFLPGTFFVGGGHDGRDALRDYADYFDWRVRYIVPHPGRGQDRLRRELASLETLLGHDPTLASRCGLAPGVRCRVTGGPLLGAEGFVEAEGPRAYFTVRLTLLGQSSVPCEISREFLEPAEAPLTE